MRTVKKLAVEAAAIGGVNLWLILFLLYPVIRLPLGIRTLFFSRLPRLEVCAPGSRLVQKSCDGDALVHCGIRRTRWNPRSNSLLLHPRNGIHTNVRYVSLAALRRCC